MKLGNNTRKPGTDVEVFMKCREEFRDMRWVFEVGNGGVADLRFCRRNEMECIGTLEYMIPSWTKYSQFPYLTPCYA